MCTWLEELSYLYVAGESRYYTSVPRYNGNPWCCVAELKVTLKPGTEPKNTALYSKMIPSRSSNVRRGIFLLNRWIHSGYETELYNSDLNESMCNVHSA